MMVPAPGLFSMITVAPRSLAISCARVRAITSVPPPGAKGTTILTILSGYPAKALSAQNADSKNAASANRADAIFILRLKTMCTRAWLEFVKAPANHALPRNAMRRATNGYDARCTSGDGRRQQRWTSIRSNDKCKRAFGEDVMKHWLAGLLLLTGPSAFAQQAVRAIEFDSIPNPLRLPTNIYFGEVSGVSVNSRGHIYALSRGNTTGPAYAAAATQLLEFDAKGQFVREIGKNLYAWSFGHTVKIDPSDNIWVTDKGSDMVIKFDPDGRVVMVFGRKQEASDEETGPVKHPKPPLPAEDGRFRQVTDVAWDKAGNTFISDGYINSRVAKVDKNGNWLKSWGDRGKEP